MQDSKREPEEGPYPAELCKFVKNIDLYNFAFFVSDGFSNLSPAVGVPERSGARQSTQNHLAHLTESARLAINGCAVSYD